MMITRILRRSFSWCVLPALFCGLGIAIDGLYSGSSKFRVTDTKVEMDTGAAQLAVHTLIRKNATIGVPLYCIVLRDNQSGKELPLVTVEDTFQEASIAPRMMEHDADHVVFAAGKGTVEIGLPNVKITGLPDDTVYRGAPRK